jgi:3-methyladenine DNA glycosylase Tag
MMTATKGGPMEAPKRVRPRGLADYLEVMTKSVFQSGISWRVIEAKWEGFRAAFRGFNPEWVAGLDPPDVDHLAQDTRIVRNRRKIEATMHNARTILDLDRQHEGFREYLRSHADFDTTVADLRKRFKFLGDLGACYFLYVVGERVPDHEEWVASHGQGLRGNPRRSRR